MIARRLAKALLCLATLAGLAAGAARADTRAERFVLANGIELVVVVDRRAPIVTHAVAFRVGAAEDPRDISGVAHFLEHLMYKATATRPSGSFSQVVSRLAGSENAVTSHDTTIFHQRAPKEALGKLMALEADRLGNIRFDDEEALKERQIVIEERRQRIDLSPLNMLNERLSEKLFDGLPYARPVLGWPTDIERLTARHAEQFYRRYYTSDNLVLLVSGDVEPEDVRRLATDIYGGLRRSAAGSEPEPLRPSAVCPHAGHVEWSDKRVSHPALVRSAFAAIPASAGSADVEALEILARILAQGDSSRLHKRLVDGDHAALSTDGGISLTRLGVKVAIFATARPGVGLDGIGRAIDEEIEAVRQRGVTDDELADARGIIHAADLFERDRQSKLALRYAEGIARGETIASIEARSRRLQSVTRADVERVARTYLARDCMVTGHLLPMAAGEARGDKP